MGACGEGPMCGTGVTMGGSIGGRFVWWQDSSRSPPSGRRSPVGRSCDRPLCHFVRRASPRCAPLGGGGGGPTPGGGGGGTARGRGRGGLGWGGDPPKRDRGLVD